jgi:hypothetical protein
MASIFRITTPRAARQILSSSRRGQLSLLRARYQSQNANEPPKGNPPVPPKGESAGTKDTTRSGSYIGTARRLPEFNLTDKVVLISGAARGLGLVQAEALLEAGAIVYALDRLPEPSAEFLRVQKRAAEELGKLNTSRNFGSGECLVLMCTRYYITLQTSRCPRRAGLERGCEEHL